MAALTHVPFPNKKPLLSTTTIAVPNQFQKTPGSYTKCRRDPCILSLTPGHCIYWQQETRCANNAGNICCNLPDILKPHPSLPSKLHHPKFLEVGAKDLPWETIAAWISSVQPSLMASSLPIPAERPVNDPLIQKENHKVANSLSCLAPSKHMVLTCISLETNFFLPKENKICPHIDQLFQVDSKCHIPHSSSLTNRPWSWHANFQQVVSPMVTGCRNHPFQSFFINILPFKRKEDKVTNEPDISWLPPLACSLEYFYSATCVPTRKILTLLIHWKTMV